MNTPNVGKILKFCRRFSFFLFALILSSCKVSIEENIDNQVEVLEFEIRPMARIVVQAKLGNVSCNFMIDTGCDSSVLSEEFANRIGKSFLFPAIIKTFSGRGFSLGSRWKSKDVLKIGNFNFGKLQFVIGELDDFMLKNIHGIIGTDILQKCILNLDYSKGKGYLIPRSIFNDKEYSKYEKLKIDKKSLMPVEIENKKYKLLVDSGAEGIFLDIDNRITFSDSVVVKNIESKYDTIISSIKIDGKLCRSQKGIKINNILINDIVYQTYKLSKKFIFNSESIIAGIVFISKLDWIFDYHNNSVYIFKPDNFTSDFKEYKIKEVVLYRKLNALWLKWENNENPLIDITDIKSSDKIIEVNGVSFKDCIEKLGYEKGYDVFLSGIESLDFNSITVMREDKKVVLNRKK